MLSQWLSGILEADNVRSFIESFNMGIMLILFSHFLACIWIMIGIDLHKTQNKGWISKLINDER